MRISTILASTVLLLGARGAVLDPTTADISTNEDGNEQDDFVRNIQQKDLYSEAYEPPEDDSEDSNDDAKESYSSGYTPQRLSPKAIQYQQQAAQLAKDRVSGKRPYPKIPYEEKEIPDAEEAKRKAQYQANLAHPKGEQSSETPASHSFTPTLDSSHRYSTIHVKSVHSAFDKALFNLPANFSQEADLESIEKPITPGSWIVRVQYGAVNAPGKSSGPASWIPEFPKPCDKCFITAMQGDLRFKNGTRAYPANGISLKQMTLYNSNEVSDLEAVVSEGETDG
jgi:hypothetical protein